MKNFNGTINQHYVPRFILRNFTSGKKDQVYVFDKKSGKQYSTNIKNVAVRRKFYEYKNKDGAVFSIEEKLGKLENDCAPIVRKIVQTESIANLSADDRLLISLFVAVQFVRTEQHRNRILQISNEVSDIIHRFGGDPYHTEGFFPFADEDDLKQFAVDIIQDAGQLVKYLVDKTWILQKTAKANPFYISDNPVTLQNDMRRDQKGNLGMGVEGIEIYLPLSKTLTLGLVCSTYEKTLREAFGMYRMASVMSDSLNLPSMMAAPEPEPRFWKLLEGIESGNAIVCQRENVQNLNFLQVKQSHQYVYSSTNDFSLAKKMLE